MFYYFFYFCLLILKLFVFTPNDNNRYQIRFGNNCSSGNRPTDIKTKIKRILLTFMAKFGL